MQVVSFNVVLTVVFLVLKLTGLIAWSWVWVLSPMWIPMALMIAFGLLYAVIIVPIQALCS